MNVIETSKVGRRYGNVWALRDCTLTIPEGHLVALVGPNGAGKSTLLNLVVGLTVPSSGEITVLGGLIPGSSAALDGIAFVAQDMSLHRQLSVTDMVHLTRNLNRHFDASAARRRLREIEVPEKHRVGKLSGGQQAQLALTLALARHPRLLVLDEPTAPLDPLARHDFMAAVMTAMTDEGVSVVLSSHLLAELERVADYLVLISHGRVRIDGAIEDLLATHRFAVGPAGSRLAGVEVIESTSTGAQTHQLIRLAAAVEPGPNRWTDGGRWEFRPVGVEELAMAYLRESVATATASPIGAVR